MKQILIIDDESQIRWMLKKMLEKEGFRVIVASDGNEGMTLFNKRPVDLVITDIIMPDKEGIGLIMELRQCSDVPILVISGGGSVSPHQYLELAKLLGANAVFKKPILKKELLSAVNKALSHSLMPS